MGGLSIAHNDTADAFSAALIALRGEVAAAQIGALGAGRFVSRETQLTAGGEGTPEAGTGLSLHLRDATYLVDGAAFSLAELGNYTPGAGDEPGIVALDVPPSSVVYGYLSLRVEESTGAVFLDAAWENAPRATARALGTPCFGRVTSNADSVTEIDLKFSDVIWSAGFLQSRIDAILALASGGGGAGNGGGTGGGFGGGFGSTIPITDNDTTSIKSFFDDKLADLAAQVANVSGAAELFPAPFDILADEVALNRAGLAEVNPPAIERGQISVAGANFGLGQNDTPNYSPSTGDPLQWPFDTTQGTFGT